jgi:hypothetical protein
MRGYILLFGLVLFFIKCGSNTTEFKGGIPAGLRAVLNGNYWEADSTSAYTFTSRSSTSSAMVTMMVIKGYRRVENYMDELIITLHDDEKGIYSTTKDNYFVDIRLMSIQGEQSRFYAYPPEGQGEAEIFNVKDGVIDGHFNCLAMAEQSQDSLYVEAGSFKLTLEDHTTN